VNGSPNVSESPILGIVHELDPPCRRERRNRGNTSESEECHPSQRIAELVGLFVINLAPNRSNSAFEGKFHPGVLTYLFDRVSRLRRLKVPL